MDQTYEIDHYTSRVIYGETLASIISRESVSEKHIIVVTNQRYYDLFLEKITGLFPATIAMDWYICNNSPQCNTLEELTLLIDFTTRFSKTEEYLFIGLGNEGVMDLIGFYQGTTVLTSELWQLPVSIRSLARVLRKEAFILKKNHQVVLSKNNLPTMVLFDQTLSNKQTTGKMIDFLIFVVCGLVCDYTFLRDLYRNYDTPKKLLTQPFNALIEPMLHFYQTRGTEIEEFGRLFEEAFYLTENGHLLSSSMKRFLGVLLHLLWSNTVEPLDFHIKNFFIWFARLGYPLDFPEQILVTDYVEACIQLADKQKGCLVLADIGKEKTHQKPQPLDLLTAVEYYQNLMTEIRGI